MVEIGFFRDRTTVTESIGIAEVEFGVLTGQLGHEIIVDLDFESGTATGLVNLDHLVTLVRKQCEVVVTMYKVSQLLTI